MQCLSFIKHNKNCNVIYSVIFPTYKHPIYIYGDFTTHYISEVSFNLTIGKFWVLPIECVISPFKSKLTLHTAWVFCIKLHSDFFRTISFHCSILTANERRSSINISIYDNYNTFCARYLDQIVVDMGSSIYDVMRWCDVIRQMWVTS